MHLVIFPTKIMYLFTLPPAVEERIHFPVSLSMWILPTLKIFADWQKKQHSHFLFLDYRFQLETGLSVSVGKKTILLHSFPLLILVQIDKLVPYIAQVCNTNILFLNLRFPSLFVFEFCKQFDSVVLMGSPSVLFLGHVHS